MVLYKYFKVRLQGPGAHVNIFFVKRWTKHQDFSGLGVSFTFSVFIPLVPSQRLLPKNPRVTGGRVYIVSPYSLPLHPFSPLSPEFSRQVLRTVHGDVKPPLYTHWGRTFSTFSSSTSSPPFHHPWHDLTGREGHEQTGPSTHEGHLSTLGVPPLSTGLRWS